MSQSPPPPRPLESTPRAIIVGASGGIGTELVRELLAANYVVAALDMNAKSLEELKDAMADSAQLFTYVHDVTEYKAVPALFQQICREIGGLDAILYVAGVMPPVAIDEYNTDKDILMMEVNTLGAIAWLNEAAARFERAGAGQIVGISSIAGDRGRIKSPVYNTSKAALSTYLEALRNRLTRHGVSVVTIKPGMVETGMLEHVDKRLWVIPPESAAKQIKKAMDKKRQTVYVSPRWGLMAMVIRHIPSVLFRRLSI